MAFVKSSELIDPQNWTEYLLSRPSGSIAFGDQTITHPEFTSPLSDCHRLTSETETNTATAIIGLRFACSPLAIVRLIVSIVIEAFKGMARRSYPHVSEEILKRSPAFTHANTPAAITYECIVSRIATSLSHVNPRFVRWRSAHSMSLGSNRSDFFPETSAGFGFTTAQRARRGFRHFAAVALANPPRTSAFGIAAQLLHCHESTEFITDAYKVLHFGRIQQMDTSCQQLI
jgi:hypothetical protein